MPETLSAALTYVQRYAKEVWDNVHVIKSNKSNRNQKISRGCRNGGHGRGGRDNHGWGHGRGRGKLIAKKVKETSW